MDWDAGVRPLCPGGTGGLTPASQSHMMHDNEHDKVIQKDCEK